MYIVYVYVPAVYNISVDVLTLVIPAPGLSTLPTTSPLSLLSTGVVCDYKLTSDADR